MNSPKMNAPDELYARTKVALLHLISENVVQRTERLPTEDVLSKQLGVSRVLLRDVLGELQARGYIARRRGKGTVINIPVCLAQPRIDEEISFFELIRSKGMTPMVKPLEDRWISGTESGLPAGAEILRDDGPLLLLERLFYGDGVPLIHSKILFKGSNIVYDYKKWSGYGELSPSEFLEIFCRSQATVTLVELDLCEADAALAGKLEVPVGKSLFHMSDTRYDFGGGEIVCGQATLCAQILPMKLVRHVT